MLGSVVDDAQTAVTSLGGAIAGVASDQLSNYLLRMANLNKSKGGLGDVGLRFIVRAGVTSVIFGAAASVMPATADNVFFSIVFFAGNRLLVQDAVRFAQIVTGMAVMPLPPLHPSSASATSACACK